MAAATAADARDAGGESDGATMAAAAASPSVALDERARYLVCEQNIHDSCFGYLDDGLSIHITRNGYEGAVALALEGVPAVLSTNHPTIPHDVDTATLRIRHDGSSEPFPWSITATLRAAPLAVGVEASSIPLRLDVGGRVTNFGDFDTRSPDGKSWVTTSQHGAVRGLLGVMGTRALMLTSTVACELGRYDAATGAPDTSFGIDGVLTVPGVTGCPSATSVPGGGDVLVQGSSSTVQRVVRITSAGALDLTYGSDGHLDVAPAARLAHAWGRTAVAADGLLHRYDASGHDDGFPPTATPWTPAVVGVAPDGSLLAAASGNFADDVCHRVFRAASAGGPDRRLGADGWIGLPCYESTASEHLSAITEDANGEISVAVDLVFDNASSTTGTIAWTVPRDAGGVWSNPRAHARCPEGVEMLAQHELAGTDLVARWGCEGAHYYSVAADYFWVDVQRLSPEGAVMASGRIASNLVFTGFVPTPHSALLATNRGDAAVLVRMRLE